jgi:hypothetical protein
MRQAAQMQNVALCPFIAYLICVPVAAFNLGIERRYGIS